MDTHSIIVIAGGPAAIARASKASGCPVTVEAVAKWRRRGLPERHWNLLTTLSHGRVTIADLHEANEELRRRKSA